MKKEEVLLLSSITKSHVIMENNSQENKLILQSILLKLERIKLKNKFGVVNIPFSNSADAIPEGEGEND